MVKKNKIKPQKTKEDRQAFYNKIIGIFGNLGIWSMSFEPINEFNNILMKYVETGEHFQGKIPWKEQNREIYYILTNTKHIEPTVHLLHKKF
jgi:hypothetical protein